VKFVNLLIFAIDAMHREYYMALSVSHRASTQDTNIILRALARGLIRKEPYHIMFIIYLNMRKSCSALWIVTSTRDQYHFKGYDKGAMISISVTADKYSRNVLSVLYM
jgi:hypothetical protein